MQIFHLGTADSGIIQVFVPWSSELLERGGAEGVPSLGQGVPGTTHSLSHLGLEPHFSCVHFSSISCLTGEAVSLHHLPFQYPLKIIARRSFHLGAGSFFIVVLPVLLKSC